MTQGITGYFDIGDSTYHPARFGLRVYYSEAYDIGTNTSVLSIVKLQAMSTSPNGWSGVTYYPGGSIQIGGSAAITMDSAAGSHSVRISQRDIWTDIAGSLGESTVSHHQDGSGSADISVSLRLYTVSGGAGSGAAITGSQTVTLTTIPRASEPTVSGTAVLGSRITVYTNRKSPEFANALYYSFAGMTGSISNDVLDSASWEVPYELAQYIPDSVSGTGTIYCNTYKGDTLIGTGSCPFTVFVPDNEVTKPSGNLSISPSGNLPEVFGGQYIQGKTALQVVFNAASAYSSVSSCVFTVEGRTYTGDSLTTENLSGSGEIPYVGTVVDARGYRREFSGYITAESYSPPYISDALCQRCDSNGIPDTGGTYLHLRFTMLYAAISGNVCRVYRRHREQGGSYGAETEITGNGFDFILPGITTDPEKAYQVQIILRDTIGEREVYTFDIASQFHTIHLKEGGKGIAFGKRATKDNFSCAMNAEFGATGKVAVWEDSEGGNIQITSPNGVAYQADAHRDDFRLYTMGKDNTYRQMAFSAEGKLSVDSGLEAEGYNVVSAAKIQQINGVDLNTLGTKATSGRVYWVNVSCTNKPLESWGVLSVEGCIENSAAKQTFTEHSTGRTYTRVYANGGWLPWSAAAGFRVVDEMSSFTTVVLSNKNAEINEPTFFRNSTTQRNQPVSGRFWGLRETFVPDSSHVLLRITEQYPVPGRMWFNAYDNVGGWSGWKSLTPT